MPHRCLSDFLEELGAAGELARVETAVDPCLEIAEVTARVCRAEGPALLFHAVRGQEIPVLTNLLGTQRRICRALGAADLDEITQRVARLVEPAGPEGWLDRLRASSPGVALGNLLPRRVKAAACQQIVRLAGDVDLSGLPLLACVKGDSPPTGIGPRRGRPGDFRRRGVYRRARFAPPGGRPLRPRAAGSEPPGGLLGRP